MSLSNPFINELESQSKNIYKCSESQYFMGVSKDTVINVQYDSDILWYYRTIGGHEFGLMEYLATGRPVLTSQSYWTNRIAGRFLFNDLNLISTSASFKEFTDDESRLESPDDNLRIARNTSFGCTYREPEIKDQKILLDDWFLYDRNEEAELAHKKFHQMYDVDYENDKLFKIISGIYLC